MKGRHVDRCRAIFKREGVAHWAWGNAGEPGWLEAVVVELMRKVAEETARVERRRKP